MDGTRTKYKRKTKKSAKNSSRNRSRLSVLHLRLLAAGGIIACLGVLLLLSSGSAARRLLLMGLPAVYGAPYTNTAELPPISIRVEVDEGVSKKVRIEVLTPKQPQTLKLGGNEPRILIYHTHNTEAYKMSGTYKYEESKSYRTYDQSASVIAVGELLAKILSEKYGCNVLHDKSDHEPPKLSTSYTRSEITMKRYKEQYPSLVMFIDVHRDAGNGMYVDLGGKQVARLMFVVGTGEGATGTGFKEMPDYKSNYALALAITNRLASYHEELVRNVRVKTSRYNQHISSQCLLVEVGDHKNTLEQALNAVPYLAKAIVEVVQEEESQSQPALAPALRWAP